MVLVFSGLDVERVALLALILVCGRRGDRRNRVVGERHAIDQLTGGWQQELHPEGPRSAR
jgi:hypothetical protein